MKRKSLSWNIFGILLAFMVSGAMLISCGNDDDDESKSVSSDSLIGRSFTNDQTSIDDDGNVSESHTRITFTSASQCSVRTWGFDWIWYDEYRKERYDKTESCSYIVSGSKITLKDYPFYAFGGDLVLEYCGEYLDAGYDDYYFEN